MISAGEIGNVAILWHPRLVQWDSFETVRSDKKFPLGRVFILPQATSLKVLALPLLHASNRPAMPRSIM
jgi:hypothetical protein